MYWVISDKRVRQLQVRLKIPQCWISAVAACVFRNEIPLSLLSLFEQSSRKPLDKFNDLGKNLSFGRRLSDTWKGNCMHSPDAVGMRHPDTWDVGLMVSPPQMPVPLKHMYNANIPRAEITTVVPSCPLMWHTIIKPKLSFFKNCFENGMLTSCVLSYAPMLKKWAVLPRSPKIFLRPFPEKTQILLTPCVHPKISHNSYTSYHR